LPPNSLVIDVSQAQKPIDWQAVKAGGIAGVIVRATQGIATSHPVGVDTAFVQHIDGALAAGLKVGVYHAFIASRDGNAQAQFFHSTVAPYLDKLSFPLAIDVELDNGQTPDVITGRLFDMASTLEALGQKPVIYTSAGFWNAHTIARNDSYFGRLPLWVAHWTEAAKPILPRGWTEYALWQYTSDGAISGVEGRCDVSRTPAAAQLPQSDRRFIVPVDFPYVLPNGGAFNAPRDYSAITTTKKMLHEGADFAPTKTAVEPYRVIAPADGKVVKVGFDKKGYGNYIILDHGDGFTSWLAHLKEPSLLKVGAKVEMGDLVGYAGSTGNTSTGTHCHWTLQRAGVGLDNYVVADVVPPLDYVMV